MTTDTSQENYFTSYGDLSVHELMLKDRPRTLAYRQFFEVHGHLVKDKVVMDVGAGTGILSLFAASAGARKVLAVEASSIASLCEEIVAENNLSQVIEVIHGTVETILLPEGITNVDIIISEWMGFYLLHESMLDSVIVARDRFLASDGILVPSHASLFFAPVDMSDHFQDRAEEWSNIYGFDFSPVASQINIEEVSKPLITTLRSCMLCADPQEVLRYDLKTITADDVQKVITVLKFPLKQDSKIFGFAAWFNIDFSVGNDFTRKGSTETRIGASLGKHINERGDACSSKDQQTSSDNQALGLQNSNISGLSSQADTITSSMVMLKTGPNDSPTHWKQTVLFLPRTILVERGINLCCRVNMTQDNINKRHYNISVTLIDEDDDEDSYNDEPTSDVSDSGDSTDHAVPCTCGSDHCRLIAALVSKYDVEHNELREEAEMIELEAEVEAAKQLDKDIETGGWQVDSNTSGLSTDESITACTEDV